MNNKIVIASVLKPVDDVRAYWKIAQSIAKTNKYEVNIIGNRGKNDINQDKIYFIPHSINRSQWIKRIAIRYLILFKTLKLNPSVFIVSTHELLAIGILAKFLMGCKVIYDVQENYKLNASINGLLGQLVGIGIRLKEILISKFVDQFWLAEKCYSKELPFSRNKNIIIQNKPLHLNINRKKTKEVRALFSGTISDYSGARLAMKVMLDLSTQLENFKGIFIGQIHDSKLDQWLHEQVKSHSNITLHLSPQPVPYGEIVDKIIWANLGVIAYQANEINQGKIPTKMYEYARYRLPYIVQINTLWARVGKRLGGTIPIDFKNYNEVELEKKLKNRSNLFKTPYHQNDSWEHESKKVSISIENLPHK